MRTIEDIQGRCVITDDEHWLWRGSLRPDGRPNIYAPDYTRAGLMKVQAGPRAVWHCSNLKPVPTGWRVFGTCDEKTCCNPDHVRCISVKHMGAIAARSGVFKGNVRKIIANRATGRKRSKLTPELITEIQASDETGVALAKRLGLCRATISKARRGEATSFGPGIFSGLIRGVGRSVVGQSLSQ